MTLADFVASFLKVNGVKHVFGIPGGENVFLIEALRRADLDFILFSHETSAGFAAGVTGELTGIPGVCLSTVGPGAVNLVAAAAAATLERSPMLAITADIDSSWSGRVAHMNLNLAELFAPVSKGSFTLEPSTIETSMVQAWQLAQSPPAGAVHLTLSLDIASLPFSKVPAKTAPEPWLAVKDQDLIQVLTTIRSANRVMIIAGLGVPAADARNELIFLAESLQAPVAVTPKIKGSFPENHPFYAGCFSAYGDAPLRKEIEKADLVLGVGLDSVDFVTSTWQFSTPVINLNNAHANDIALNPTLAIEGDVRGMLRFLNSALSESSKSQNASHQAMEIRRKITEQLRPSASSTRADGLIPVYELINAMQQALPADAAVTLDVGVFKLVFLQQWQAQMPKSLFVANGLSAMGYAVPGALGIRLAQPDRPVVAIVGDGALMMYAGELATVTRIGRPLVILVVVDEALSLIRLKQLRQKLPVYGTEFHHTDFKALAFAFGLEYRLIDRGLIAQEVIEEALRLSGPVLLEARISNDDYDQFR